MFNIIAYYKIYFSSFYLMEFSLCYTRVFAVKPLSSCPIRYRRPYKLIFLSNLALKPTARTVLMNSSRQGLTTAGAETSPTSHIQISETFPELYTEFMVDMKCEGCVNSVKNALQTINGVKNIEVDLSNQIVRILGSSPVTSMMKAFDQTGKKARLIGQGKQDEFAISAAAVAEFKGPNIYGVVRIAQVSMETARLEANFSGLPNGLLTWSINEYGDLTNGALSTGKIYQYAGEEVGELGKLEADEKGDSFVGGLKKKVKVGDLIGRSVVVYRGEDRSDGIAAAVVARSAGVGENHKKICSCDGTVIWDSSYNDFAPTKL